MQGTSSFLFARILIFTEENSSGAIGTDTIGKELIRSIDYSKDRYVSLSYLLWQRRRGSKTPAVFICGEYSQLITASFFNNPLKFSGSDSLSLLHTVYFCTPSFLSLFVATRRGNRTIMERKSNGILIEKIRFAG